MLLQAATQLAFASRRVGAELLRFRRAGTAQCTLTRPRLRCLCDSGFREHDRCQADDEKINSHAAPHSFPVRRANGKAGLYPSPRNMADRTAAPQVEQLRGATSQSAGAAGHVRWLIATIAKAVTQPTDGAIGNTAEENEPASTPNVGTTPTA
jgi:hypothetical protein